MTDSTPQADQPDEEPTAAPDVPEDERPGEVATEAPQEAPGPAAPPEAVVPDAPEGQAPVGDMEPKPAHREPTDPPEGEPGPPGASVVGDVNATMTVSQAPTAQRRGEGGGEGEVVNLQQGAPAPYQGEELHDKTAIVHANQAPTEGEPVVDDGRLVR